MLIYVHERVAARKFLNLFRFIILVRACVCVSAL